MIATMHTAAADTLTDHIIALISEAGLEGVSVRAAAHRAGISIGAVQHYFPTKAAMLTAAMKRVADRASADLPETKSANAAERLQRLCDLLVPASRDEEAARVWVAFAARAVIDPGIEEIYCHVWSRLQAALAEAISAHGNLDAETAGDRATMALALADGLTTNVLAGSIPVQTARTIMRSTVRQY